MVNRVSFMSSHRWRGTFVGEARTSDVIASRRLASDWLGDDIMWKCGGGYEGASALTTRTQRRCSTILPPVSTLPLSPSGSSVRFRHLRSSSRFLPLGQPFAVSVDPVFRVAFPPLSFFRRSSDSLTRTLPLSCLLPTFVEDRSVSIPHAANGGGFSLFLFLFHFASHLTSPHFTSPHLASPHPASRRLFRGSVSALRPFLLLFLLPVSRSVPDAFASSLPFDHNSRLTNIVNTPALSGETRSPRDIP